MNYDNEKSMWTRICPSCNEIVFHKTKAKCRDTENHKRPCVKCSRSNIGKKNAALDTCPVCNAEFKQKVDLESHAKTHDLSGEELWVLKSNTQKPMCRCGCGESTTFLGWNKGWQEFVLGHNGNIYNSYDTETAQAIAEKRSQALTGTIGWAKGLTKETDTRIAERAVATSIGRKTAFDSGELTVWSKGLTKETDERLTICAEKQKERFANGELVPWMKGLSKHTDERVKNLGIKVSIAHKKQELREYLDNLKRLSQDDIENLTRRAGFFELIGDIENYKNDKTTLIHVRCKRCGGEFHRNVRSLQHGKCNVCYPQGSIAQAQITEFIKSLGLEVKSCDRTVINPLELDIFVPSHNFAIEFNGLYWHSEQFKSSDYHNNKSILAARHGISLFHVFEDEWSDKREIIESMIRQRLGMSITNIDATNCHIVEVSPEDRTLFFENNHIDDDTNASMAFGLTHENSLVACISLRKPFHKKYSESLEVARFCTSIDTSVVGGLNRLSETALNYVKENGYKNIITNVDTRFGSCDSYENAKFKFIYETAPRFWWTDSDVRYNQFKFRADAKNNLTESQVASLNGVIKIWGCSNKVYQLG